MINTALKISAASLLAFAINTVNAGNSTTTIGSTLTLNTPIKIAPNKADAYFQYGKRVSEAKVDEYYPNCNIEISSLSSDTQTLNSDTFTITRVIEDEVYPFSGETAQAHETIISLSSSKQPDVLKLTCSQWGNEISDGDGFVTKSDIKEALGTKFSLN